MAYDLEKMTISKTKWDKRWRIVMFDVPEKLKKVRETLRYQLKRLGFLELQRSVFIFPFECSKELEYVIEFYNIKKFVRFAEVDWIDNELDLKHKFRLV
ncbi:MAG: CRISPR-associated endonuclease Cas2 [Candidatus Zambryskibacteria bacterium]|nr:CRISPR-associated endonuclease Cas2 [Candidatus Zambryskibacteria bacterium]